MYVKDLYSSPIKEHATMLAMSTLLLYKPLSTIATLQFVGQYS